MSVAMADWIRRHRITVDEYYKMFAAGIISEDARVELIEGEIIDMEPIGTGQAGAGHAGTIAQLTGLLVNTVGQHVCVRVQLPMRLSDISEPVPDFALVTRRADHYKKTHPGPGDTLLIVEVSRSSLRYDLQTKASLYACHLIPEYWVINLPERQIRFCRSPQAGQYTDVTSTDSPGRVAPIALPNVQIDLTQLMDD